MRRITKSAVIPVRNAQLIAQNYTCPLCEEFIKDEDAVLDHDHADGRNRAVLHRGCNAALGKVENARPINNLKDKEKFRKWCTNIPDYVENAKMESFHWSHRTKDEKKILARKRVLKKKKLNQKIKVSII